jgi:hypothetical protein
MRPARYEKVEMSGNTQIALDLVFPSGCFIICTSFLSIAPTHNRRVFPLTNATTNITMQGHILVDLMIPRTTNDTRANATSFDPSLYCPFNTSYFLSKPQVQYLGWSYDTVLRHNEATIRERTWTRTQLTSYCLLKPQVQYLGWSNDERVRQLILTTNETSTVFGLILQHGLTTQRSNDTRANANATNQLLLIEASSTVFGLI